MKKVIVLALAGAVCALVSAVPAAAADHAAATSGNQAAASTAAMRSAWPPETLSGTISMIDPDQKLVVVEGPDKAEFDMVVTPETRIRSGNQNLRIGDLSQYQNQPVSVKFIPERRGDVAQSIRING